MSSAAVIAEMRQRSEIRRAARRWPRDPYVQALLMYAHRWAYRAVAGWMLLWAAGVAWSVLKNIEWHSQMRTQQRESFLRAGASEYAGEMGTSVLAWLALLTLPGAVAVAAHLKERLTGWQGALVPGYRRPQLVVGGGMMALVVLSVMAIVWTAAPWDPASLLGAILLVAAIGSACATLPPRAIGVVGIGSVLLFALPGVRLWLAQGLTGVRPEVGWQILSAGVAAMAAVAAYVGLLRGESAAKQAEDLIIGHAFAAWRRRAGEDVTTMRWRRRVRLWRVPSSTGLAAAACGVALFAVIAVLVLSLSSKGREYATMAFPLAGLSIMAPGAAVASQWAKRLSGLGYEMSRPVTRRRFVRDAGTAMARDWAAWWGWLTAGGTLGVVLSMSVASEQWDLRWGSESLRTWGWFVAASGAMQVISFGITAWVMRFQSPWAVNVTALVAVLLSWIPAVYAIALRRAVGEEAVMIVITGIAITGCVIVLDAYRRWLRVDVR